MNTDPEFRVLTPSSRMCRKHWAILGDTGKFKDVQPSNPCPPSKPIAASRLQGYVKRQRSFRSTYEPPRTTALRTPMESYFRVSESGFAGEQVRWRPWPCSQCAAGATPVGFLAASHRSNPQISDHASTLSVNERIEHLIRFERDQLSSWCSGCAHEGGLRQNTFFRIAEGSEHIVYKTTRESDGLTEIVKVTHPGLYGDYYEMAGGPDFAICVHTRPVSQADGIAGHFRASNHSGRDYRVWTNCFTAKVHRWRSA